MTVIACDIDDTVLDLVPVWLRKHNRRHKDSLTFEQCTTWAMDALTPHGNKVYEVLEQAGLYRTVQPIAHAVAGLRTLRRDYRVVFITASALPSLEEKMDCLVKHGLLARAAALDNVAVMHDKSLIRADILIDDRAENVEKFPGPAVLFDRPWNRNWTMPKGRKWPIVRCTSWETIPSFVDVLLEYSTNVLETQQS